MTAFSVSRTAPRHRMRALGLALGLAAVGGAQAAPSQDEMLRMMKEMNARIDRLERRNSALEQELNSARNSARGGAPAQAAQADAPSKLEARVQVLEQQQTKIAADLEKDTISEKESELTARLKAIEFQGESVQKAARMVEALEGVQVGVAFTAVAQHPEGVPRGVAESELNYRGDASIGIELPSVGNTGQHLFAHFRIGQGAGLNGLPVYAVPNGTVFSPMSMEPDSGDSFAVLGQLWYQATIPLPFGGFAPSSKSHLHVNFGKMDPFVFFDQNAVANDESIQFLNSVFVHNALLDAGGDVGVDSNGFSPGLRMAYINESNAQEPWMLSFGVFGAGEGANFSRAFSEPFLIAQAGKTFRLFEGMPGTYRAYYWRNGQAGGFDETASYIRKGFGLSVDQQIGSDYSVFARFGKHIQNDGAMFDRTWSFGGVMTGNPWNRGDDRLGLAFSWQRTSSEFADYSAAGVEEGSSDYAASGNERVAELYYSYRLSKELALTPSLQYITRPGGNSSADDISILGLRANVGF